MGRNRRLTGIWALCALIATGAVLSCCLWVDPFGMINPNKPLSQRLEKMERLYKPWAVYWIHPRSLALGNSRFYYSIGMDHPGWRYPERYNLSLTGASMTELELLLRHTLNAGPVDQMVVALDGACDGPVASQLTPNRLLRSADTFKLHRLALLSDFLSSTVVLHAAEDLLFGVKNDFDRGRALTFDEYHYQTQGQGFATREREQRTVRDIKSEPAECTYNSLQSLLAMAYQARIETSIVINPVQIRLLRVQERAGEKDKELEAKTILQLNQDLAAQHGIEPFPVLFFNTVNSVTAQPIPPSGSDALSASYWYEPSHYKKGVGDWILDRALGGTSGPPPPSDFGVLLTPSNNAEVFSDRRLAFQAWVQTHPQIVADIDKNVDAVLAGR